MTCHDSSQAMINGPWSS